MKWLMPLDLNKNEIQNFRVQNLAVAPLNPVVGQHYFNTVDNTEFVWNGTEWIDALSMGNYNFQNGIKQVNNTRNVQLNIATGLNAGNVELVANENGLRATVGNATNEARGVIRIATDDEIETGTSEILAVNPKQLHNAVDGLIKLNDLSISYGSQNYLEYDETNGVFSAKVSTSVVEDDTNLITSGAVFDALQNTGAAAVNNIVLKENTTDTLTITKNGVPTDITITQVEKAIKDSDGNTITDTYATKQEIEDFIKLDDLTISYGSQNYLSYDNTNGVLSANVDDVVTNNSTNLITSGAVHIAVNNKIELTDLSIAAASANHLEYNNTTGQILAKVNQANGLLALDANGLVSPDQLPSFVDDVLNVTMNTTAPATCNEGDLYYNTVSKKIFVATDENTWSVTGEDPETGKIYINTANNMSYRWSGLDLVQIGADKLLGYNTRIDGDGETSSFTITHNLGTRNVVVEIYEAVAPYEKVYTTVNHVSTNAVQIIYGMPPAVNENYNVTIVAIG